MQHDGDHRGLESNGALDRQIGRGRGFRLDPIAKAAECAVGGQRRADRRDQRVENRRTIICGLNDNLQFRPVLIVIAQRRQRHLRIAGLTIAQNDQPGRRDTLRQDFVAQDGGGKRLQPRM